MYVLPSSQSLLDNDLYVSSHSSCTDTTEKRKKNVFSVPVIDFEMLISDKKCAHDTARQRRTSSTLALHMAFTALHTVCTCLHVFAAYRCIRETPFTRQREEVHQKTSFSFRSRTFTFAFDIMLTVYTLNTTLIEAWTHIVTLFFSPKMLNLILGTFLCALCFVQPTLSFYIPGVAPLDFEKGDNVEVKVIRCPLKASLV